MISTKTAPVRSLKTGDKPSPMRAPNKRNIIKLKRRRPEFETMTMAKIRQMEQDGLKPLKYETKQEVSTQLGDWIAEHVLKASVSDTETRDKMAHLVAERLIASGKLRLFEGVSGNYTVCTPDVHASPMKAKRAAEANNGDPKQAMQAHPASGAIKTVKGMAA